MRIHKRNLMPSLNQMLCIFWMMEWYKQMAVLQCPMPITDKFCSYHELACNCLQMTTFVSCQGEALAFNARLELPVFSTPSAQK